MKTVFQWLLVAACLFTAGNVQVMASSEEKKEEVKISIPISTGEPFDGNEARGGIYIPFTAYYQAGTINVSTSAELSVISLNVVNETTGQVWSVTTDVSDGMGEISIANSAPGSYTVEILTEYDESYIGFFELQN